MLRRARLIPPKLIELWGLSPFETESLIRKESLDCLSCGAKLRGRRLAQVILEKFPVGNPPKPCRSLADWSKTTEARALRIAEFNRIDGVHDQLTALPRFTSSEFHDTALPGSIIDGVRVEDLTALTFLDESFDLILTSETLEHVADLSKALSELHRVLAPGGLHIFTIPILPSQSKTFARKRIDSDGNAINLAAPIFHPGGDIGYPVFTEFGLDAPEIFERAGFHVEIRFGPIRERDIAQVFVCEKAR
ncbi:MAG: class I SAM-dependent methyltransferase [Isosphaeraceae bacterium]